MRTCCRFPLLLPPMLVRPRPVPFRPTLGTLRNHKAKAEKVSERDEERTSCHLPFGIDYLYFIKGAWGCGSVVVSSSCRFRGQILEHLSSRVCEDPMHCCSPVPDPEFLVKTVYLLWARVTHDSRDDQIQYIDIVQVYTPWLIVVKK